MNLWKMIAWLAGIWLAVVLVTGCSLTGGNKIMDAMAASAETLNKKIQDEGVLKEWMVGASGHVQNPGVESYVEVRMTGGVRAIGVDGNVEARGSGDATRLPAGVRDELIKELGGPISDARRDAIMVILGWNRTPTP
jgi:hypothetical protein